MSRVLLVPALGVLGLVLALVAWRHLQRRPSAGVEPVSRVVNRFAFEVRAPYARTFPLFGAHGERAWAGARWDPRFLYPQPPRDEAGEVFTLAHGHGTAVWVNTVYDPSAGRVQYVSVVPGAQTATIDIQVRALDAARTGVEVSYRRTALDPSFNARLEAAGRGDRDAGPEWAAAIETALSGR